MNKFIGQVVQPFVVQAKRLELGNANHQMAKQLKIVLVIKLKQFFVMNVNVLLGPNGATGALAIKTVVVELVFDQEFVKHPVPHMVIMHNALDLIEKLVDVMNIHVPHNVNGLNGKI